MGELPLLQSYELDDVLAWAEEGPITCRRFLGEVAILAETLPDKPYVVNLCQDRYLFFVGLAAALSRGQVTLLPPGRAPGVLQQVGRDYQDGYYLIDKDDHVVMEHEYRKVGGLGCSGRAEPELYSFRSDQLAVIAFTSGSTGQPCPNPKTWGSLVEVAKKTGACLGLKGTGSVGIVATVPPQHMYGLETSIMLPVQHGWALYAGRPFFPEDIRSALGLWPSQRLLVTTPFHLRACVAGCALMPPLKLVLSATAPLPRSLATRAEEVFKTRVVEVYGFTEAGTIAVRRTVEEETWRVLDGLILHKGEEGHAIRLPYLGESVPLPDVISLKNPFEFVLHGRSAEFVNIAGHRVALGDLNHKLNEVDGVRDGVVFMPDEIEGQVTRPVALVVAPGKTKQEILSELRTKVDPVFLPRPLYLVDSLPRNETGKLPRESLLKFVASKSSTPP